MSEKTNKNSKVKVIKVSDMKPEDVPLEGSLGLLAAGYKGIMLWRNRRKEHHIEMVKKQLLDNDTQE